MCAVTAAASNNTIITIAASAGGGFVVLVACIIWARSRLTRRMQHYRTTKLSAGVVPKAGGEEKAGDATKPTPVQRVKKAPAPSAPPADD